MLKDSSTASLANRNVHRTVLPNGMVVLAVENPAADIISARIFVRAGGRYEQLEQAGISHLLTAVLTKGTTHLSAHEIAERVESVGASLGVDAGSDYSLLSFKTVSADFIEIFKLAAELLRSPTFPESEVELERRFALQGIRSMQEQPSAVAQQQLRQAMYQSHPYALSGLGTEETVSQIDREALLQYYQTHYRPDNMVVSIVGNVSPEEAIALTEKIFGDWTVPTVDGVPMPLPTIEPSAIASQPGLYSTPQDTNQAIVMLGYLTASVHHPDYLALKLISTYLGNGLSSRLFVELREKQGLAYEVSSFYPTRLDSSQFVAHIGTAPDNAAIALAGLHREIHRLKVQPLTDEELQTSKNKLLGQYALGKQTNAQIAQILGWYEILGLGIGFDQQFQDGVAAVTIEAVQEVANRYFTAPYVSLVGPEAAIASISYPE